LIALAGFGVRAEPRLLHDLALLEDEAGTLTIDAVAGGEPSLFKSLPSGGFSGGYTHSFYWFRFTVTQAEETWFDVQPPVLEDLSASKLQRVTLNITYT
jgi:hypothetical protein